MHRFPGLETVDVPRAASPWLCIRGAGEDKACPVSPPWPDGVGPKLSVVRNWGRAQGPTGELKIKPVCFRSLGGSPAGRWG